MQVDVVGGLADLSSRDPVVTTTRDLRRPARDMYLNEILNNPSTTLRERKPLAFGSLLFQRPLPRQISDVSA